ELTGGDLRVVAAPVRLDDRLAAGGQLPVQAEARRDALPVEEVGARKRLAGRLRVVVELVLRRRERLAVVGPYAHVQRHAIAEADAVVDERADVADLRRVAERLPDVAVAVHLAVREVGVDEIVVAVDAGYARLVVLHAEVEVLLGAEEA